MEPPNKGHYGDNINSAVMYIERLSPFQRLTEIYQNYRTIGRPW